MVFHLLLIKLGKAYARMKLCSPCYEVESNMELFPQIPLPYGGSISCSDLSVPLTHWVVCSLSTFCCLAACELPRSVVFIAFWCSLHSCLPPSKVCTPHFFVLPSKAWALPILPPALQDFSLPQELRFPFAEVLQELSVQCTSSQVLGKSCYEVTHFHTTTLSFKTHVPFMQGLSPCSPISSSWSLRKSVVYSISCL